VHFKETPKNMNRITDFANKRLCIGGCLLLGLTFPNWGAGLDPHKPIAQFHQDVWGPAEGLPADTVPTIVQTSDGYLWFGTELGLVRFDGLHFTIYNKTNTPALKSNVVDALAIGNLGELWIGTRGGGVVRLKGGEFVNIPTREAGVDSVLCVLRARDGSVWIGTDGGGVLRLENEHLARYTTRDGLPSDEVFALAQGADGSIWIGTRLGLSRFAHGSLIPYKDPKGLPNNYIRSLYVSEDGALWIGTNGGGLSSLKAGQFRLYTTADGLSSKAISAIRQDSRGTLWIGTVGGGLCRMAEGRIDCYGSKQGLPGQDVWALYEDDTGDLWIGTGLGGLARLSNGKLFRSYGIRQGLSKPVTLPVFEDHGGDIWIGTYGGGLNRLRNGDLKSFSTKDGLPDDMVFTICEDNQYNLWIGTRKGLTRLRNGVFKTYTKHDGLPSDIVDVAYADAEGNVWIGTRTGLGKLSHGRFTTYTTKNGMSSNVVQVIFEDRDRNLWVGTAGGGLNRFKNGKFDVFDSKQGLSSRDIFAIYEDAENTLWIGTDGGGLNRFKNGRFISFTSKQGLADDAIFEILEDGANNLWMTSNKGVFRVSKAQLNAFAEKKTALTAVVYGVADGMDSAECDGGFQPAGWKSRDGRLWFPTTKGVVTVDPRRAERADVPPLPVLEEINIDGVGTRLQAYVKAPPGRGNLEIHYSAPDLQSPQKTLFRYKLVGFDRNWVEAGTRRIAYYTNIAPGTYRFEVIAGKGKIWSPQSASVRIQLRAHFYQTFWFYTICILAFFSLALAAFFRHLHASREREAALARRVEERTAQLRAEIAEREHAELELMKARDGAEQASRAKSEFLANMSHEIRTPMNGIFGMIDLALSTDLTADQYEYLTIVKNSADSLLTVINDILDLSKVEAGKLELDPVDFDLRETLEETARLMAFSAEKKHLKLVCDLDPEIPELVRADPIRLRQIVLNLLGNAIKFTEQGEVVLKASVEGRNTEGVLLHFLVRDTGMGIAPEQRQIIFEPFCQAENSANRKSRGTGLGLTISHRLIELMGGKIWVNSELGHGSDFHFTLNLAVPETRANGRAGIAHNVDFDGTRVLVVDDGENTRRMLANALTRWGARTRSCSSGIQAVSILRDAAARDESISIVLADTQAFGAADLEEIERMRRSGVFCGAIILMCRSSEQRPQAAQYRANSVVVYLTKPIRQRELRDALWRARTALTTVTTPVTEEQRRSSGFPDRASISRRILVAEDNLLNQKLMLRLLEGRGHKVVVAGNGAEVLSTLDRESVDIVLMDLQMPEMDGFEATKAIREKEKKTGDHLPIVAITACALKGDRERCLEAGMDGYMAKPFQRHELFAAVETADLARATTV
jgi:signal transduction histidine kinase/ligand-binding sensor domain-containing protein/CheY-like chemotaxis protein